MARLFQASPQDRNDYSSGSTDENLTRALTPSMVAERLPRRGLRRDAAAQYVGVSTTKFEQWVNDGRMPKAEAH
jgi:hypothetical protein